MNNTVIYLIGHSPAARLAVAQAIAAQTGARIVDSQALYAPVFNVVEHGDLSALPDAVWSAVDAVRGAVLGLIETVSPRDWSFVFTHAGFDIPADVGVYRTIRRTAEVRGARFFSVTLTGGTSRVLLRFEESDALAVAGDDVEAGASAILAAAPK